MGAAYDYFLIRGHRVGDARRFEPVGWPCSIDTPKGPILHRNHIQLNSMVAGKELRDSFFSASTAPIGSRRPGHYNSRSTGEV